MQSLKCLKYDKESESIRQTTLLCFQLQMLVDWAEHTVLREKKNALDQMSHLNLGSIAWSHNWRDYKD